MLEKEVVRYSRNGVQIDNISTGETRVGTVSKYGKEARYSPDEQSHYKFSSAVSTESIQSTRKNILLSEEERHVSGSASSKSAYSSKFSNVKLEISNDLQDASPSQNVLSKISDVLLDNVTSPNDENDNIAVDTVKQTTKGVAHVAKKLKKRFMAETTKVVYNTARTTQVTATTAKTAKAAGSLISKVLANPAVLKGLGIVALIVLGLLLLQMLTSGIVTAIGGGVNEEAASAELKEYIFNLDKAFISEVENKAEDLKNDDNYSFVSVTGLESVATVPVDMQILLLAFNDFDITLTERSKVLLNKFHSVLNTYSIEPHDREAVDEEGNSYTQHGAMIYVSVYGAEEKMMSFNPDEEQISMLEAFFEIGRNSGSTKEIDWPIQGYRYISSNYGSRVDPITGQAGEYHTAIDIPMPMQTPLLAGCDGTIIFAGERGTYGNLIKLRRRDGLELWYAHCDSFIAEAGDEVKVGDWIGLSGNSGRSTGPHLHFEVRKGGQHQDPLKYLK